MNMREYFDKFPNEEVWRLRDSRPYVLHECMLEFTADSAHSLAGPFNVVYAYSCIMDGHQLRNPLLSMEKLEKAAAHAYYNFPRRFCLTPKSEMSDHRVENLLKEMTKKELKDYYSRIVEQIHGEYSKQNPWGLFIAGNDDCTWTKFFPSLFQALEEKHLLEVCQPLSWHELFHNNRDYYFTN